MEWIVEILKVLITFISAFGASNLWMLRQQRRKLDTEVNSARVREMGEIIDEYINRMSSMSDRIIELMTEVNRLKEELMKKHTDRL